MQRRSFLKAVLSAVAIGILSRLPGNNYGAVFQVVKIDNTQGPRDYEVPVGTYVYNGHRCCKNCQVIFSALVPGGDWQNGPSFVDYELKPMNREAKSLQLELDAARIYREHGQAFFEMAS